MNKIWAVARAEYLQAVRSKAFLIGLLLMPVLMGGSIAIQVMFKDQVDLEVRRCVVHDPTGELFETLEERLVQRNEHSIWEEDEEGERKQMRPTFELERYEPEEGVRADLDLAKRVRSGELLGYLLIGEHVLDPSAGEQTQLSYYTETPTFTEFSRWFRDQINDELRARRIAAANLDVQLVNELNRHVPLTTFGLPSERADGSVQEAEKEHKARTFAVPAMSMFLLFMLLMTSAPTLMNQVLEEKMQRISEVLVSAVTPFQLMFGKLLGIAAVSMTLALMYLGAIFWATHHFGVTDFVPGVLYLWIPLFLLLALLMYGSLFSALGSACSEIRDAQSMMLPAMVVLFVPLFAWQIVLENPNGGVATALTLWPTSTPLILLLRVASQPGPPLWELIVGLISCLAATVGIVAVSGKIFRIGVLSQGQTPSFRQLIGWVMSK